MRDDTAGRTNILRTGYLIEKWLCSDKEFSHFDKQKIFLEKVLNENPGLPCFCFGHSTGAAIILKVMDFLCIKWFFLQLLVNRKAEEVLMI